MGEIEGAVATNRTGLSMAKERKGSSGFQPGGRPAEAEDPEYHKRLSKDH